MLVISDPAGQLYILYERVHGVNVEKYVEAVNNVYGVAKEITWFSKFPSPVIVGVQTTYWIVMTALFVLIADEVGEYIPFTWTITCKLKYPV